MNRCNLILHCGAHAVERRELSRVQTPGATETWQPIPHEEYVMQVERELPRHGLSVVQEAHALTHDGGRYFGLMQIQNGCSNPDYSWVLGLRNSHDKTLPAGLVAGSEVMVCDNLAFEACERRMDFLDVLNALRIGMDEAVRLVQEKLR